MKLDIPILMDEVCTHWKRLGFDDDDDGAMKNGKLNIFIVTEWEVIQERFLKVGENIKFQIKEKLRKILRLKKLFSNSSTPKSQKCVFKGACISKPPHSPPHPKIQLIDEMPIFMHKYVELIVNVVGDVTAVIELFLLCSVKERLVINFLEFNLLKSWRPIKNHTHGYIEKKRKYWCNLWISCSLH